MKKTFLLFFLIFIISFCFSQEKTKILEYFFDDTISSKYIVNPEQDIKNYLQSYPEVSDNEDALNYFSGLKYSYRELLESRLIVKDKYIFEDYLNRIFKQVVPDSLIQDFNLNIFISTEDEINASATDDGTIIFNLYNFIYLESEAEIAFILAHEVAHVLAKNGVDLNILYDKYKKAAPRSFLNIRKRKFEKYSIVSETLADKMACKFVESSSYSSDSGLKTFELFKKIDIKYKTLKNSLQTPIYLKTHPISQNRLDSVKLWIIEEEGYDFIIDQKLFAQTKQEALIYILKTLMDNHSYLDCIELALENYLNNQNDQLIYYIIEPIRRRVYQDKKLKTKPLLFEKYILGLNYGIPHYSKKIFIKNCDSTLLYQIKKQKIYRYEDYWNFFSDFAIKNNIQDCYLTIGLKNYKPNGENLYLNKYLQIGDNQYKDYVNNLLTPINQKITFPEKEMLVFNELSCIQYKLNYGIATRLISLEDSLTPRFNMYIDSVFHKINTLPKEYINMDKVKYFQFNKYLKATKIYLFFRYLESNKVNPKKIDKYLFEPDLWNFMNENQISRLDFINMYDVRIDQGGQIAVAIIAGVNIGPSLIYVMKHFSFNDNLKKLQLKSIDVGSKIKESSTLNAIDKNIFTKKNFVQKMKK